MKSLFILDCENLSFQLNLTHSKIKKLSEMKTMPD